MSSCLVCVKTISCLHFELVVVLVSKLSVVFMFELVFVLDVKTCSCLYAWIAIFRFRGLLYFDFLDCSIFWARNWGGRILFS